MAKPSLVSRRRVLGSFVVGCGALLTACGAPSPKSADPSLAPAPIPVVGSHPASAPPTAQSAPSDPLAAVAAVSPTAVAATRFIATPTDVIAPTAVPTGVPSASPTAIIPSSPTPIPIAYDASRLSDVLGESITSYAGSIPTRVHNVQLATSLINGARVAPGAVFSFDDRVGDQTEAHGFQVAWGIISNNGVPETVKADAGGICQVATTVFQSAYWAGLPMVERHHHLYWIAHYGQPPYGGLGLDATVDFAPVDLQFRNTTSDWIRIDASYDSTHVHVQIIGVSQGWKVTSGTPNVMNMVKVDRATVRREDPTSPPGTQLLVESAQDGFDVTVERLVKSKQGDLVDRYVFTNHYEPAHNVLVVGTKGLTPTPTGSATPLSSSPTPALAVVTPTATPVPGKLPDGRVRLPSLVGMPEASARQLITSLGLQNAATNYQGPNELPAAVLNTVPVGAVLSQLPPSGSIVGPGSTVYIAVRKS